MNAVIVSVQYADFLSWTLPTNRHHFDQVVVVTSTTDQETVEAASPHAQVIQTDAFTENLAKFNKYAGIELGLDAIGRSGWIAVMDADILLPGELKGVQMQPGNLYVPFRRMCHNCPPPAESDWRNFPRDRVPPPWHFLGYCQIFHASDPVLGNPPWHGSGHKSAARGDMIMMEHWPRERRIRPGWEVLHLGEARKNWNGRVTPKYQ